MLVSFLVSGQWNKRFTPPEHSRHSEELFLGFSHASFLLTLGTILEFTKDSGSTSFVSRELSY